MQIPNIFEIATKELHQDAFITWLIQYADNQFQSIDKELNQCSKEFITKLIQKQLPNFNEKITNVKAGRQWKNIDVWVEINNKYFLIIEDKIDSGQHSNQLIRYKEIAKSYCNKNNFHEPICIYLKTGNESLHSLNKVVDQDYKIFNRIEFLNILESYTSIDNNIFLDFKERLIRLEKANYQFENKKIKDWNGNDWQGFFQFLEIEYGNINWHYVNNPNGGFWNAVLTWDNWDICPAYIQLEQDKLCFKVSTHPADVKLEEGITRQYARNSFYELIMSNKNKYGLQEIKKPQRFGNGNYMTSAIVEGKFWLGNTEECINKYQVIENLNQYKKFIRNIIK
jgi:hypothetical protein